MTKNFLHVFFLNFFPFALQQFFAYTCIFSQIFFHLHFSYFSVSILNFRSFLSHFIFLSAIYFIFSRYSFSVAIFCFIFFFLFISQSFGRHQLFSAKGVDNCIQPIEFLLWRFSAYFLRLFSVFG